MPPPPLSSRSEFCDWDYASPAIALNRSVRSMRSDGVIGCHPIGGDLRAKERDPDSATPGRDEVLAARASELARSAPSPA